MVKQNKTETVSESTPEMDDTSEIDAAVEQESESEPETTFVDRLQNEYNDVADRLRKIEAFMLTETYAGLTSLERSLLTQQVGYMVGYRSILEQRLALYAKV